MRYMLALAAMFIALPSHAQLSPPNAAGITYGHTHLVVSDLELHKKVFVDVFGGTLLKRGDRSLVKYQNMIIAFYERAPNGPSQGSVVDHFGFRVQSLAQMRRGLQRIGVEVQESFTGAEGFANAYAVVPGGLRLELQEDITMSIKAVPNHVHFYAPAHTKLLDWYVDTFAFKKRSRGRIETTADAGTVNLTFGNAKEPTAPTRGRSIDHIGFEVDDLEAFTKQLQAKGIKLDVPLRSLADTGLKYAFITDPSGTYIELTEGLDKY